MKKKLIFKKGIRRIVFPFMLHNYSSWQDQVIEKKQSTVASFLPRKNVFWGYRIENGNAEIYACKDLT